MKYNVKFSRGFKENSFCYFCLFKKNLNAVLYEVNMTGHETITDNYSMERQGYYTYLLNYTLGGSGVMEYKGRQYNVSAGDLIFIDCAERHKFKAVKGSGWEFVYLHISGLGLQYLYDSFTEVTGNIYRGYDGKSLCANISELHGILSDLPMRKDESSYVIDIEDGDIICKISEIIYRIMTDIIKKTSKFSSDIPYPLSVALNFIGKNFTKNITLDEIAHEAYLSKFHFERIFKEHMKMTVHAYISELRLKRAMLLLENTDRRIADIAAEVGYSDVQALVKLFKKNTGVTPAVYRSNKYHYPPPET